MKEKTSVFEWVVFGIFVVLEIVLLVVGLSKWAGELNLLGNFLYNIFQIAFSLYIGYFLQKIDSVKQFRESLKQYGLSAYRRITDIRKSVDRTIIQINKIGVNYPKDRLSDLDALSLILQGTFDTVESSIADWGEIIGQEIRKKEEADLLQAQITKSQEKVNLSEEDKKTIEGLTRELYKIKSELPAALQNNFRNDLENVRVGFLSDYLQHEISSSAAITMFVMPNPSREIGELADIIENHSIFLHAIAPHLPEIICIFFDEKNVEIGQVIGPFGYQAPYQATYLRLLLQVLDHVAVGSVDSHRRIYKLEGKKTMSATPGGELLIIQVPVPIGVAPWG